MVEVEPVKFNKVLRSVGLNEVQIKQISSEFSKNDETLDDERLLDMLLLFGKDIYNIISVFEKFGIGRETVVTMVEERQKRRLGGVVDVYTLEVVE